MKKFKQDSNFELTPIKSKYTKTFSKENTINDDGLKVVDAKESILTKRRKIQIGVLALLVAMAGFVGILGKNKKVEVIIDGEKTTKKTNHFINSMLFDKLSSNIQAKELKITNENKLDTFVHENQVVEISTLKNLKAKVNGKDKTYTTYADTLAEFLAEQKPGLSKLGKGYTYQVRNYKNNTDKVLLKDVNNLAIDVLKTEKKQVTKTEDYDVQYINNKKLASGTTKVKQKGVDKKYIQEITTTYVNGKKDKTTKKTIKVLEKGQPKIVERGTKVSANYASGNSVWDKLAKCESGGNWAINSGNGFYGGVQFMKGTWDAIKGKVGVTADYPHQASREDQIKVASYLQKQSGWGQWPACSAKLGLR